MNILKYSLSVLLPVFLCCASMAGAGAREVFDKGILPGAAQPAKYMSLLSGLRVALIINQASQVGDSTTLDMLLAHKVNVVSIFVPEHGFRGTADAGAHVDNTTDSATGIPVISLYGNHKKPKNEELANVDVLVYDLQDVGARFYTYISTMEYCMEACAETHKRFVVLDRPNPLGFVVDGPVLDTSKRSFIGMQPIPVIYGMTPGEYALMLAGEGWVKGARSVKPEVVTCAGYDHNKRYQLPISPSPNLRNMASIYAYPSLCLFEGTAISPGRGTDKPFQQYGAPGLKASYNYTFTPVSGPIAKKPQYENEQCYGELVAEDPAAVLQTTGKHLYLGWLIKAYSAYPDKDKFFTPFFTKLAGTTTLADQVRKGMTEEQIRKTWQPGLNKFRKIRKKYLLYTDAK